MTLREICIYIEQYNIREKRHIRERAITDFKLAGMISAAVWYDGKRKQPEIYDFYSEIFEEEKIKDNTWQKFKMEMIAFSLRHNKTLKNGGGDMLGNNR